jgi:hypothetical protein
MRQQFRPDLPKESRAAVYEVEIVSRRKYSIAFDGHQNRLALIAYILEVFISYAREISKMPGWSVDQVATESEDFLRGLTMEAYGESGCGDPTNHRGEFLPELNRMFRQSAQWKAYEDVLLDLAQRHIAGTTIATHLPSTPIPKTEKSLSERCDDLCLNENISQEELAARMGLSRSTYFAVKAGGGGRKAKAKAERYFRSLESDI